MLTYIMTKGLARERHEQLLGLMGVRTSEGNTTPSSSGRITELGKNSGMESSSGSVELRATMQGDNEIRPSYFGYLSCGSIKAKP